MRVLRKADRNKGRAQTDINRVPPYPAPPVTPKRSIRRLMKRDPAKGIESSVANAITETHGTSSGVSPASVTGRSETRRTRFGTGKRVIKDRGQNRRLKKY